MRFIKNNPGSQDMFSFGLFETSLNVSLPRLFPSNLPDLHTHQFVTKVSSAKGDIARKGSSKCTEAESQKRDLHIIDYSEEKLESAKMLAGTRKLCGHSDYSGYPSSPLVNSYHGNLFLYTSNR